MLAGSRHRRRFNTQPPEGGWVSAACNTLNPVCFNTQPPEGGWLRVKIPVLDDMVSTHSRLKAAGHCAGAFIFDFMRFNTQPPEGGWQCMPGGDASYEVSTHSRLKAAAQLRRETDEYILFQHTAA